jgi:hypothetical protein
MQSSGLEKLVDLVNSPHWGWREMEGSERFFKMHFIRLGDSMERKETVKGKV